MMTAISQEDEFPFKFDKARQSARFAADSTPENVTPDNT
jgi:hypothetical protein